MYILTYLGCYGIIRKENYGKNVDSGYKGGESHGPVKEAM